MRVFAASQSRWLVQAGRSTLLLAVMGCTQPAVTSSVAVPPIPATGARIWLYRDYEPYTGKGLPAVAANGRYIGAAELGGTFYRNVPPGQYHVTVETYGEDFNQSAQVQLAAGQEAYVKILSSPSWVSGAGLTPYERPTFYAWLIPSEIARYDVAHLAFYGGS